MIDHQIRIIQGFRVPRNKLFKRIKRTIYLCKHVFDRKKMKFCSECGQSSGGYERTEDKKLLNIDFDRLQDNDYIINEDLILTTPMTNCEENEDYIIGIGIFGDDPTSPENMIELIKQIPQEEVLKKINNLDIKIPYDKNSFGIYILFDIY